ncbi:hypothetical protein ANG2_1860, partial [Streptococcus constellatus subsp. constellatus SK53]
GFFTLISFVSVLTEMSERDIL